MYKVSKNFSVATLALLPSLALAQAPMPPAPAPVASIINLEETHEESYIGLNWQFGGSFIPQVELGHRKVDLKADGDVNGYEASLTFDIEERAVDKVLITGVLGDDDFQGELGGGYSFSANAPIGYVGAQGNRINAGVTLDTSLNTEVSIGINSISDYD